MIVFIVGGTTYEEAKEIAVTFNGSENKVMLGGTYIHNSKSFMADISQIQIIKGTEMLNFEIE